MLSLTVRFWIQACCGTYATEPWNKYSTMYIPHFQDYLKQDVVYKGESTDVNPSDRMYVHNVKPMDKSRPIRRIHVSGSTLLGHLIFIAWSMAFYIKYFGRR